MNKLGIDFKCLKKQAQLGESTVEKLINGDRVMISVITKLCIILGCDLNDIVAINYEWDIERDNGEI